MNTTFDRILWKKNKHNLSYPIVKKTLLLLGYIIESSRSRPKISAIKRIDQDHRFHFVIDKPIDTKILHCGINLHKDINIGIKRIDHVALEYDNDIKNELAKFCNNLNNLISDKRKLEKYDNLMFKFRWT